MFWFIVIVTCLALGYGFFECGRYIAINRSPSPELPYPRERLARRLGISALLILEMLFLVGWTYVSKGTMGGWATTILAVLSVIVLVSIFLLLLRDLREVRDELKLVRSRFQRELLDEISDLPSSSSNGPQKPEEAQ